MFIAAALIVALLLASFLSLLLRWGSRWGATKEECAVEFPGDRYLGERRGKCAVMTRAVSLEAPPETVWPWLAQMGRGAGYYSYDRLDNGGKRSARHIVSWIPQPELGDAAAFGYLRHLETGREMVWWVEDCRWIGATWRGAFQFRLVPFKTGCRLLCRMSAEATGPVAWPAMWAFQIVDSIMSRRQLLGIKDRCERYGARADDPDNLESGERDQYQEPLAIYASGDRAGRAGEEEVGRWRQAAIRDGVLPQELDECMRPGSLQFGEGSHPVIVNGRAHKTRHTSNEVLR